MKVLSVVCARAGSKGLENKCIKKICDKMVVEYSINYSLDLGSDVKTVVSTDVEEIVNYCDKNKISYLRRSPEICTDESKIDDALADAIEKEGKDCKYCSLVYGNIPIRYVLLFSQALEFLEEHDDYGLVVSMQNVEKYHPDWMFDYNEELLPIVKETHYRRQNLPQKMLPDGHTFLFKTKDFYKKYKGTISFSRGYMYAIFGTKVKPMLNNKLIIDIDTEKDLKLAEAILESKLYLEGSYTKGHKYP